MNIKKKEGLSSKFRNYYDINTRSDIAAKLFEKRVIMFSGDINFNSADALIQQLLFLEHQDKDTSIYIYINSPGGCIYSTFMIVDTMMTIKCNIETFVTGIAASGGALIFVSGNIGNRYMLPSSTIMIHQALVTHTSGKTSDIEIEYNQLKRLNDKMVSMLSARSLLSKKEIKNMINADCFLDATESIKHGFADYIIQVKQNEREISLKTDNLLNTFTSKEKASSDKEKTSSNNSNEDNKKNRITP